MGCTQREAAIKFRRLPYQIDAIFNKYREEDTNGLKHILSSMEEEVIKLFGNDVLNEVLASYDVNSINKVLSS